jgi:hypothetical protein
VSGHCEQGIYRDRDGGYAGSWSGNEYRRDYRGRDGSYAGSADRHGSGWIYRDRTGGYAGSSTGPSDRNPFVEDREDD